MTLRLMSAGAGDSGEHEEGEYMPEASSRRGATELTMPNEPEQATTLADKRQALLQLQLRRRRAELGGGGVVAVGRGGLLPLSWQQLGLWFLYEWDPGSATYHMPLVLRLRGGLDRVGLAAAVRAVLVRHEGLRCRFVVEEGRPGQVVDAPPVVVELPVHGLPVSGWQQVVAEQVRRPFRLAQEPGFRWWLGRLGVDDHVLVLNFHHIVTDGWSVGILAADLGAAYRRAIQGPVGDGDVLLGLAPLSVQPADYAVWQHQHRQVLDAGLAYWAGQLADLPTVQLPADRARPAVPSGAGAGWQTRIEPGVAAGIVGLAAELAVSPLAVLLAGFSLVLHRYTGQTDLPIGSIFSGRTRSELEPLLGYLANTLVLRADLSGDPTGRELIQRWGATVLAALAHQDVPFGAVVEELKPERVSGRNPLFQIALSLVPAAFDPGLGLGDLTVEQVPVDTTSARFDLSVQITQHPDNSMTIWIEYSTELFDRDRVERLVGHFETVLAGVVADPGCRLSRVGVLPPVEAGLLGAWDSEVVDFGTRGRLLQDLVSGWAARSPDAVALRCDGVDVSYAVVEERANRLGWLLQQEFGVGPERLVGVLLDRGPGIAQAQLAVLKAGGGWLPLDPAAPAKRIGFQLADAGAVVVITDSACAGLVPPGVPRVLLDDPELAGRLAGLPVTAPSCAAGPDNAAYLIYTSGSTGTPKGVLVSHRAVVNFVGAAGALFGITPADRLLQFANPAFDVSIFDTYAALAHGATAVGAPRAVLHDVEALADLLRTERISVADLPPAVLGLLDPDTLPDLRALFVGLEAFPADLVNRWRTPQRQFHNGYGPTEATVACVDYPCPPEPLTAAPPIGRALPNQHAYVLDPHGNLAPIGIPGQLHIAGVGLARGYLGQPALTAERFLPCPFGQPGQRMYATGDIAAWQADGQLRFLGRADRQIKIRGLRIELGEIEHALTTHPDISQATVTVTTTPTGPRLDAYLIPHHPTTPPNRDTLHHHLLDHLPLHMIPTTYTVLDTLPLTANGKLDREQLPEPSLPEELPHQPPASETERLLAGIWQELVKAEAGSIGRHDSFFQLGGTSLIVMQVISRIRRAFGVELAVTQVFQSPVLCDLAAEIDRLATEHALDEADLSSIDAQLDAMSDEEIERMLGADDGALSPGAHQGAPDQTSGGMQ